MSKKLMIVAHPDDESIFGFSELISDNNWKVVSVSDHLRPNNESGLVEFKKAMSFYNIIDFEIWDFTASLIKHFPSKELDKKIKILIQSSDWGKIVTHNPIGEYGHIQHKDVFDSVQKVTFDFFVFCKDQVKLNSERLKLKNEVLSIYSGTQDSFLKADCPWWVSPDNSSNYIEYGNVSKYSEEKNTSEFINCLEKEYGSWEHNLSLKKRKSLKVDLKGFSKLDDLFNGVEMGSSSNLIIKDFFPSFRDNVNISFLDGPKVSISGNSNCEYNIRFIDSDSEKIIFNSTITSGMWSQANQKFFVRWLIEVEDTSSRIVESFNFDCSGKIVYIKFSSKAIGDTIAWIPYVEEFRLQNKCKVICSTFHNDWFKDIYPNVTFVPPGSSQDQVYTSFSIGWYYDKTMNPGDVRTIPLQRTASDILGLRYREIKPSIKGVSDDRPISQKYVCISVQSTAQAKYWNWPGGWEKIVEYLHDKGYKVVVIDKSFDFGNQLVRNVAPKNAIDKTNGSLDMAMNYIKHAELFIGLGSGLAWMSWAIGTPVILISSFSKPWCEFSSGCERLYNDNDISGYYNNLNNKLDPSDWNWNPIKVCKTKEDWYEMETISPLQVKIAIDKYLDFNTEDMSDEQLKEVGGYFKYFEVNDSDIVVDLGACIGSFAKEALKRNPSKCYCVEGSKTMFDILKKEMSVYSNVKLFYKFIGDNIQDENLFFTSNTEVEVMTFYTFVTENNIKKIDFLKIDVEGSEFDIIRDRDSLNWISRNVRKIAGELHLLGSDRSTQIYSFIKSIESSGFNLVFNSLDGADITENIVSNKYLKSEATSSFNYYDEVLFFASRDEV